MPEADRIKGNDM